MTPTSPNPFAAAAKSAAAAILFTLLTAAVYIHVTGPGDLSPPPPKPAPSPEGLGIVMDLTHTGFPPIVQREISIPRQDVKHFHQHLEAAAMQQGWFAYEQPREGLGSAAIIIMPADELHMLDDIEPDPIGWTTSRNTGPITPRPPSDLNLVKAGLDINPSNHLAFTLWILAAAICTIGNIVLIVLALLHCENALTTLRRKPAA